MSDFESICLECDESFEGRKGPCPKCGSTSTRIYTMDGKTAREWRMIEAQENRINDDDE
jgi:rRNA maturation endonuclease Nob1